MVNQCYLCGKELKPEKAKSILGVKLCEECYKEVLVMISKLEREMASHVTVYEGLVPLGETKRVAFKKINGLLKWLKDNIKYISNIYMDSIILNGLPRVGICFYAFPRDYKEKPYYVFVPLDTLSGGEER